MRDVFLLGAGFSIAIDGTAMPSTDDLGQSAVKVLQDFHHDRVAMAGATHGTLCDGISCDGDVLVDGHFPARTFEDWMTKLAEPQPYLLPPANARNRALFDELVGIIATQVDIATWLACTQNAPPDWLPQLVFAWHQRQAHVVTLNYDTLVEATVTWMRWVVDGQPRFDVPDRFIYSYIGPCLIPHALDDLDGRRHPPLESFSFYKLHGSTHWYWDPDLRSAESMVHVSPRVVWGTEDAGSETRAREYDLEAPGKHPVIVPPITAKSTFFQNRLIRTLWRKAYNALRGAERIFVLGYSLPPADLLMTSMLLDAAQETPIYIVNVDGCVADRFEDQPFVDVRRDFLSDVDPIQHFAEWYVR